MKKSCSSVNKAYIVIAEEMWLSWISPHAVLRSLPLWSVSIVGVTSKWAKLAQMDPSQIHIRTFSVMDLESFFLDSFLCQH